MRKLFLLLLLVLIVAFQNNYAQTKNDSTFKFIFLPKGIDFMPLKAGIDEPRMGLLYYSATTNLKIDIGNAVDILGFNFYPAKSRVTVGAEFMAYAYVTSYLRYRLQIDALDGFFGGYINYSRQFEWGKFYTRLRYIHSSSHLVDGHWDDLRQVWIDNQEPTAYGNNYAELLLANEQNISSTLIRYYCGADMSTGMKTKTKKLKKYIYKAGFEYSVPDIFGIVFNRNESLFIAVNLDAKGIPEYIINQNYMVGIKFGGWYNKGIVIYTSYYNGGDVFNQYFTQRVSRFGIGFMFDFI